MRLTPAFVGSSARLRLLRASSLAAYGLLNLRQRGPRVLIGRAREWIRATRQYDSAVTMAPQEIDWSQRSAVAPGQQRRQATTPIVSVVVRTRDRPDDLELALNSLATQTFHDFEIVVVNDGGRSVEEILAPYRGEMSLTHVANVTSHGRAEATNDGVRAARGRFVSFLDDDDVVYPFHLESLVEAAEGGAPDGFVYSHYSRVLVDGRGRDAIVIGKARVPIWPFNRCELLVTNRPAIHTWLLPRALFESHGGFDDTFQILHDWDFLLRVTEHSTLVSVPEETCEYRFYLDLDNSVTGGRRRVLEELQRMYALHRSGSALVTLARRIQIAEVRQQIALASELDEKVDAGLVTRREAARAFVGIVFSMGPTE